MAVTARPSAGEILVRYAAFAVIATAANLGSQALVLAALPDPYALPVALVVGTGIGLVVKYLLDKSWIFYDQAQGVAAHGKRFSLYTLTGVATTAIFWGTEYLFWVMSDGRLWWVGAIIGLAIGYVVKYQLDRRFVFRGAA